MTDVEVNEQVVAELVGQPELFDATRALASVMAVDAPLLHAASTARRPHTGERVSQNEARALLLATLKLRGESDRSIARAIGCDRRSIPRVMERLEARGVVPPLRARLAGKIARLAESATDELEDLVGAGIWNRDTTAALKGLGFAMGVATDKALLLTGQATSISANVPAAAVVAPAELNAWVLAGSPPPDSESGGDGPKPQQFALSAGPETPRDTPAAAPFETGGGGVAPAGGPPNPMVQDPAKFLTLPEGGSAHE